MAKWALGGLTMIMGFGVLLGGNVGGRLSDRAGKRPVLLVTSATCALFIALETTLAVSLVLGAIVLFLFATSGGARFASAQAIVSEMSPGRRGTVMALNASGQQFGIVTGSALGGLVLSRFDYTGLGPTAALLALASLVTYALFVDETRLGREAAQELQAVVAS
jgi:predicted MFS family arabinose efflux permease